MSAELSAAKSLWRALQGAESDEEIFHALKQLLRAVTRDFTRLHDVFPPAALSHIYRILQSAHGLQVHCLAIALVAVVASSGVHRNYIVRKDLLYPLVQLYFKQDINLDPCTIDGRLQGQLFEHLSSLILFFSTGSVDIKIALIREGIIPKLVNFLCPFSPLYCYSSEAKDCFKQLTLRKPLSGSVTPHDSRIHGEKFEAARDAYLRADAMVLEKMRLNDQYYNVDLYHVTFEKEVQISAELVRLGQVLTLAQGRRVEGADSRESERSERGVAMETAGKSDWVNVVVTAVVNAEYFWANIGADATRQVDAVRTAIASQPEAERVYLKRPPSSGAFVCGRHEQRGFYRAQVIAADDTMARVFALDHGVVLKLPWTELFLATREMNLGKIPPQAFLCRLKGIQPKPVNASIVEHCLSTLCNLAAVPEAVEDFVTADNVNNLRHLVRLALDVPVARCKVFRLLCNLCQGQNDLVKDTLADLGVMNLALDTISQAAGDVERSCSRDLITSAAALLGNLICDCDSNKDRLADENGLQVLLPLVADRVPGQVRDTVLRTIRIFIGRGKAPSLTQRGRPRDHDESRRASGGAREGARRDSVLRRLNDVSLSDTESSYASRRKPAGNSGGESDPECRLGNVAALYSPSKVAAFESSLPGALHPSDTRRRRSRSKSQDGRSLRRSRSRSRTRMSATGNYFGTRIFDSDEEAEEVIAARDVTESDMETNRPGPGSLSGVRLVNTSDLYNAERRGGRYYVLDDRLPFKSDEKHEIRTATDVTKVSALYLSEIICSFLNGSGGSIYLGLSAQGLVRGLSLSRGQRDEFRLGLDRVTRQRVHPSPAHWHVDLSYTPVVRRECHGQSDRWAPIRNLYVIEIVVKSERCVTSVYTAGETNVPFIRKGGKSVEATYQDIRCLAVERREKVHQEEIRELQDDIRQLQRLLDSPQHNRPSAAETVGVSPS